MGRRWLSTAISACVAIGACRAPAPVAEPESGAPEPASAPAKRWIRGSLTTRAVARESGGEEDLDLYEVVALDLGDASEDRWGGHLSARAAWDLDGDSSAFASSADSKGDEVDLDLYDAYAETRDRGRLESIRLGRQFVYDTPVVAWFDGARVETKERGARRWKTGAYYGLPVHAFESPQGDDRIAGLFQEAWPARALRVRADWMHLDDDAAQVERSDDLVGLGLFHDAGGRARWEARYTRLDGADRDLTLGASWYDLARGWTLQASFHRLLETQTSRALELDPFFDTLFTLFPYDELRVSTSKSLGGQAELQGGVDVRRVRDEADVGAFNHDYERAFATGALDGVLPWDWTLSLTGESWNGDSTSIDTWGVDVSRRWEKRFDASLGSSYALFKFDPFAGSEREDVRTYYAALRFRPSAATRFQLRYEHEDGDAGVFDTLRGGWTWRF